MYPLNIHHRAHIMPILNPYWLYKTLNWCLSIFFKGLIETAFIRPSSFTYPLFSWGTLKSPLIFIIEKVIFVFHQLRLYNIRIPSIIQGQLRCYFRKNFRGIVLSICKPCSWHLWLYPTWTIFVNSDIILLLPYYQTKKKFLDTSDI